MGSNTRKRSSERALGVVNLLGSVAVMAVMGYLLVGALEAIEMEGTVSGKMDYDKISRYRLGIEVYEVFVEDFGSVRVGSALWADVREGDRLHFDFSERLDMAVSAASANVSWGFFNMWLIIGAAVSVFPLFRRKLWADGSVIIVFVQIFVLAYSAEWAGLLWL